MTKNKIVKFALILSLLVSLIFNYLFYKDKVDFMNQIGSGHKSTVRLTLFEIGEGDTDIWIENMKAENGDVMLERHIGELNRLSREFHEMSSEMAAIGMLLDILVKKYYELNDIVNTGENVGDHKNTINNIIQLIHTILTKIDADLGENPKLWYEQLSGFETKTQQYVWEEIKEFETQNK